MKVKYKLNIQSKCNGAGRLGIRRRFIEEVT